MSVSHYKHLIAMSIGLALAGGATSAHAQDAADGGFSWNAALTSDYIYRGASQTDDKPALQLGADYAFGNGLYVGVWGSNVDFGDSTDAEIDTFIGWNGDLSDSTNLDVQLNRYNYVNEPADADYAYNELIGTLTFSEQYTLTLAYTNDYLNLDENSLYAALGGSWEIGGGYNFSAGAGYTKNSGGLPSYADYNVGMDRDFGPVNVALQYIGSNGGAEELFGDDATENKFVLTLSLGN